MVSWHKYLGIKDPFSKWVLSPSNGNGYLPLHVLCRPQSDYIMDKSGHIIVDRVCRFELLDSDIKEVYARLGMETKGLPHHKASERGHYKEYYTTPESISAVSRMFAEDIRRFDYVF